MTVLNLRRLPWNKVPDGAVYIGRGSVWGNPFVIGKDGTREEVIGKYRVWLEGRIQANDITPIALAQLDGKDLVCFCAPQACHGNVLEQYAQDAAQYLAFHPEDRP